MNLNMRELVAKINAKRHGDGNVHVLHEAPDWRNNRVSFESDREVFWAPRPGLWIIGGQLGACCQILLEEQGDNALETIYLELYPAANLAATTVLSGEGRIICKYSQPGAVLRGACLVAHHAKPCVDKGKQYDNIWYGDGAVIPCLAGVQIYTGSKGLEV